MGDGIGDGLSDIPDGRKYSERDVLDWLRKQNFDTLRPMIEGTFMGDLGKVLATAYERERDA